MISIIISLKPHDIEKVLIGERTVLILKFLPKYLAVPFNAFLYCKQGKPELSVQVADTEVLTPTYYLTYNKADMIHTLLSGKIVAKCRIDCIDIVSYAGSAFRINHDTPYTNMVARQSQLDYQDLLAMSKGKDLYAYHISQQDVFDTPKELKDFSSYQVVGRYSTGTIIKQWAPIKKMPGNWVYIDEDEEK